MGGNAIFRRSVLMKVGLYTTWLGRTDKGLLSGEDEELYGRLLASGAKGMYLPNLKIYHYVVPERLTKIFSQLVFLAWRLARFTGKNAQTGVCVSFRSAALALPQRCAWFSEWCDGAFCELETTERRSLRRSWRCGISLVYFMADIFAADERG